MDFPLPLTLVLMMEEDAAVAAAAPATSTSERGDSVSGIARSSGVFSVVAPEDRTRAQTSANVA